MKRNQKRTSGINVTAKCRFPGCKKRGLKSSWSAQRWINFESRASANKFAKQIRARKKVYKNVRVTGK